MSQANVIERIIDNAKAETVISDAPHRCPEAICQNEDWRQGDIYLFYLGTECAKAYRLVRRTGSLQLAPGTGQGSRHCLDSLDGVEVYQPIDPNQYEGPVLHITKPRSVTHPEHGHLTDLRPGWWAVGYQRTGESEERARRVED